jgi:pyruvate dehydrogenase E2 component (dihydrolipoamide acetyltransferase)
MPTDVIMPQMGESIFEGTITKWLKKPGDTVQRDEPLFEISTDKVDAEIPSPAAGVLKEIKVQEGATVEVNTVVGVIDGEGAAPAATEKAPAKAAPEAKPKEEPAKAEKGKKEEPAKAAAPPKAEPQAEGAPRKEQPQPTEEAVAEREEEEEAAGDGAQRIRSSPLVRKIAKEHKVDLAQVEGSGMGGRITKEDILKFVERQEARPAASVSAPPAPGTRAAVPAAPSAPAPLPGELVPMTAMRKKIAERMVESKRTSAHVHSIFKVDMTRVAKLREAAKRGFQERHGVSPTYTTFAARAVIHGIRKMPILNSSVVGEGIQYHKSVNLGIAVALDWGLIVPVVKSAENLSFAGLQKAIVDLGDRARRKKLTPDDVQGGTFTITNPGIFGPQFGLPIIAQPQVAILGMGGIFKEPVVITDEQGNDMIAIRHIVRFSIGYDHRIIDGADADKFMVAVKEYLENWSEDIG